MLFNLQLANNNLLTIKILGDIVLIEEPYIGASYPTVTYVCNYTGCLKLSLAVISCPKCLVVSFYVKCNFLNLYSKYNC